MKLLQPRISLMYQQGQRTQKCSMHGIHLKDAAYMLRLSCSLCLLQLLPWTAAVAQTLLTCNEVWRDARGSGTGEVRTNAQGAGSSYGGPSWSSSLQPEDSCQSGARAGNLFLCVLHSNLTPAHHPLGQEPKTLRALPGPRTLRSLPDAWTLRPFPFQKPRYKP